MVSPAPLSKKLRESLGPDTGEELMNYLQEMRAEFAQSRQELLDAIRACESRLGDRLHGVELSVGRVEVKVAEVRSDLMKWSFVFWVSAVGAIAALAGVLR
jgi:hypothetical protein